MGSTSFDWPRGFQAAITLSFDDGFEGTCQATSALMYERGLQGTYHIIAGRVGGRLDGLPLAGWSGIEEIHKLGHEVGSHGLHHRPLAGPGSDIRRFVMSFLQNPDRRAYLHQLWARKQALGDFQGGDEEGEYTCEYTPLEEACASRQIIQARLRGSRVISFSFPKGRHSRGVQRAAAQAGYRSARTIDPGINHIGEHAFALKGVALGPGMSEGDLDAWITRVLHARGWLILVFHLVAEGNPGGYPYYFPLENFERLVDRLRSLPIWIASQAQVVEHWERLRLEMSAPV